MPLWIELRCSVRGPNCDSNRNNGPMEITRNVSSASTNVTVLFLIRKATKLGWRKKDKDWVCPYCRENV